MPIEVLNIKDTLRQTNNFYEVIASVGKRAAQINEQRRSELEEKLAPFRAKLREPGLEYDMDRIYPEQVLIALKYEVMPKQTVAALKEYIDGTFDFYYEEDERKKGE